MKFLFHGSCVARAAINHRAYVVVSAGSRCLPHGSHSPRSPWITRSWQISHSRSQYSTQKGGSEGSPNNGKDLKAQSKQDPRLKDVEHLIEDQFAELRDNYAAPKNPIVLAHGLLGFDELHLMGAKLPGIQYWRGITEALKAKGIEVITCNVPASGSIEARAAKLAESIGEKAHGKSVNIVAGLDSRYMISQLKPPNVKVLSLTTVATPHQGSSFADYILNKIGPVQIPKLYKILEIFGLESGAFSQLTLTYMRDNFNPKTPDLEGVRYYSYGASFQPYWYSAFRQSHRIIKEVEGSNDGMVSVTSSQWGVYKGTLVGVSHLDLINWTNRLRWWIFQVTGNKQNFNAIAFYLDIADMLAKEDL